MIRIRLRLPLIRWATSSKVVHQPRRLQIRAISSKFRLNGSIKEQISNLIGREKLENHPITCSQDLDTFLLAFGNSNKHLSVEFMDLYQMIFAQEDFIPSASLLSFVTLALSKHEIPVEFRKRLLIVMLIKLNFSKIDIDEEITKPLYENWLSLVSERAISDMELIGYKNSKVSKSLLVHYYTICRRYDDAFRIILESKLSIDRFPADLLCYHLLIREKTDQVYEILKHLYEIDRKQILSQQIINKWLHLAIHQKKIQLVEKFFFGYIYCPRVPVTELSGERLLKICLLAREKLHFNLMAKVVRFQIERMKAQQKPAETVQKFRRKMSLLKFDGLLEKLGPVRVIDSGIFHRFGLSERENITVADFSTLINGLASQFPNLSYKEGLILIEQMHGFHVTEEKYRYSRDLHPDHQLFRMIRSAKLKGEHSLLASIDMDTFFDQYPLAKSKQGVPKRQSTKYKARRPVTTKPFNVLPLNIILKVIQETTNDLNISIHLISYMVKRRRCQLDHDTLLYLFKIVYHSPSSESLQERKIAFSQMMSNLSIDLKPDQRVYEFLIDHHMKSDDLGSLISIIESYVEKGYTISNELYEGLRMKSLVCKDERYLQFTPSGSESPSGSIGI